VSKHRIGLVGCGGIAHAHIRGYREVAGDLGEVVAGCDPDEGALNSFCGTYGLSLCFTDAADLIASGEVDVIALLTPPAVRSEAILPAAERGIHMLVEKPFGENMADAVVLVKAAEAAHVKLAVNHELRFMADVLAIREIIASGQIGDLRVIAHDQFQDRTRVGGWRAEEERLEISIFSIHLLDRIQWLAGRDPVAVTAHTRQWNPDVRGETFSALTIDFGDDLVGTMVSSWHSPGLPECRLRVDGTEGSVLSMKSAVVADECALTIQRRGASLEHRDLTQANAFVRAMGESMKRLLEAVDSGGDPPHSGRDNLRTMAIVDAAYLSAARGGDRVQIAEVWPDGR
jgi:predicted dehydrogenase